MRAIELSIAALAASFCAAAAPLLTRVNAPGEGGAYSSLQLSNGNPVVSFYDDIRGHLKLATCTANCRGASPAWTVVTVDSDGDVGRYSSLQLSGGNPVIAYQDVARGSLKLATCTGGCATASPTWVITTVDASNGDTGRFPSLRLNGGNPVIAYRDRINGDLKLATCTAACASASPSWVITTVDGAAADVGRFASMQLDSGRPVIAHVDFSNGMLKLATCTGGCATPAATWVSTAIDPIPGDEEVQLSLQLDGGNPVVSYYYLSARRLQLATCTAACATATPTWTRVVVDPVGDTGIYSSMALRNGNPVIAYHAVVSNCTRNGTAASCHGALDLRLATCSADCKTASPRWIVTSIDNVDSVGWDPSLQLEGDEAVVSYVDMSNVALKVARVDMAEAAVPSNYSAIWWDPLESGWGVNFSHEGNIVFGALFTYDASGNPLWLMMPAGERQADGSFSGALYRTTGPAFDAKPFTPIGPGNLSTVGTMKATFAGDTASLSYTFNGALVEKTIKKYVFGTHSSLCRPVSGDRSALGNYQDLWWNAAESGWGLYITQQDSTQFVTVFTYDAQGRALWLMAPATIRQSDGAWRGDLYRTSGPAFNAVPFPSLSAANIVRVGTLELRFANGENAALAYTVNGVVVEKALTRYSFSTPVPACSG